jgi:hypothetical protein
MITLTTPTLGHPDTLARRQALTGILEHAVTSLELTAEQRQSVEATYREVGAHLAKALKFDLPEADIFPQGSYRLGTVIRPWRDITEVFDLDVVFRLLHPAAGQDPKKYREAVGEHLRAKYNGTVKPLAKGWRLDFSKERDYYLDLIPAMDAAEVGIIAITDDRVWLRSNPRGFAEWFANIAKVMPRVAPVVIANSAEFSNRRASIEALPEHTEFKLPLQRITQLSKRHRDYHFNKKTNTPKKAPASIVLTTLLAKSYARCVASTFFESGFDLLVECVKGMPDFITKQIDASMKVTYTLKNPSLESENLIARWNEDPELASAFYGWQREFLTFLELLVADQTPQRRLLEETMGKMPVDAAYRTQVEALKSAKEAKVLRIAPRAGLSVAAAGVRVPNLTVDGIR